MKQNKCLRKLMMLLLTDTAAVCCLLFAAVSAGRLDREANLILSG
jgi:hypothetical protein